MSRCMLGCRLMDEATGGKLLVPGLPLTLMAARMRSACACCSPVRRLPLLRRARPRPGTPLPADGCSPTGTTVMIDDELEYADDEAAGGGSMPAAGMAAEACAALCGWPAEVRLPLRRRPAAWLGGGGSAMYPARFAPLLAGVPRLLLPIEG